MTQAINQEQVGLTNDIVMDIRQRVYEMLDEQGPGSYDYHHIRRVEAECAWLATRRELDLNMALVIGLLHDIGRVWWYVYGKQHASEGAKAARVILEDYNLDLQTIDIIATAISRHSSKKCIQGPYDEVIRDADSLAHELEGMFPMKKYEAIRSSYAKLDAMHLEMNARQVINDHQKGQLVRCHDQLNLVHKRMKKGKRIRTKDVHDLRTSIRSIRSMYKLVKGSADWKHHKKLNKNLRSLFKSLETSRKLSVFRKAMKAAGLDKDNLDKLSKLIVKENKNVKIYIKGHQSKLVDILKQDRPEIKDMHHMDQNLAGLVHEFKDMLTDTDIKDMKGLHDLRIRVKLIKYLMEEKIVKHNNDLDLILTNDLHITIGRLHDIEENRELLEKLRKDKVISVSKKRLTRIHGHFDENELAEKKMLREQLFKMNKRFSTF